MQPDQPPAAPAEMMAVRTDLTFGDGFRFGCGFTAAFVIFWLALIILGLLLAGAALVLAPQLFGIFAR
jgi:hypothetical protein